MEKIDIQLIKKRVVWCLRSLKKMCFKRSVYAVENEIKEVFVCLLDKKQEENKRREWNICNDGREKKMKE